MSHEATASAPPMLASLTDEESADRQRKRGMSILRRRNCYWKQVVRGFWEPIHLMAQLRAEEAVAPTLFSWGFRATLRPEDASAANASIPVFCLPDLGSYEEDSLSSNRRNQLRRCRKRARIAQLTDLSDFQERAYEVFVSAVRRTGHCQIPSKERFFEDLTADLAGGQHLLLAGLIDGNVGGYVVGYAINGTAYVGQVIIATQALSSYIGIGLQFEFAQACRRSPGITQLVHGLHSPEDEALCTFKEGLGYRVRAVPARVQINRVARALIRRRYPDKYYRLTGER